MSHQQLSSTEPQEARVRAKTIYESLKDTFTPTLKGKIVAIGKPDEVYEMHTKTKKRHQKYSNSDDFDDFD